MGKSKPMQSLPGLDVAPVKLGQSPEGPPNITPTGQDWLEETVGALTDPIIVYPAGGWENDLPESLKNRLPLDRLSHIMLCTRGEARLDEVPDIEALLYLYPASLAAPMGDTWSRIYLYLGTKVMGAAFPPDIREKELSDYHMGELRDLKRWLRRKKVEARKARHKQAPVKLGQASSQKETSAKIMTAKPEQIRLF